MAKEIWHDLPPETELDTEHVDLVSLFTPRARMKGVPRQGEILVVPTPKRERAAACKALEQEVWTKGKAEALAFRARRRGF